MADKKQADDIETLKQIIELLNHLSVSDRERILRTVNVYFGLKTEPVEVK